MRSRGKVGRRETLELRGGQRANNNTLETYSASRSTGLSGSSRVNGISLKLDASPSVVAVGSGTAMTLFSVASILRRFASCAASVSGSELERRLRDVLVERQRRQPIEWHPTRTRVQPQPAAACRASSLVPQQRILPCLGDADIFSNYTRIVSSIIRIHSLYVPPFKMEPLHVFWYEVCPVNLRGLALRLRSCQVRLPVWELIALGVDHRLPGCETGATDERRKLLRDVEELEI